MFQTLRNYIKPQFTPSSMPIPSAHFPLKIAPSFIPTPSLEHYGISFIFYLSTLDFIGFFQKYDTLTTQ